MSWQNGPRQCAARGAQGRSPETPPPRGCVWRLTTHDGFLGTTLLKVGSTLKNFCYKFHT